MAKIKHVLVLLKILLDITIYYANMNIVENTNQRGKDDEIINLFENIIIEKIDAESYFNYDSAY